MKKIIFFIAHFICATYVCGQSPYCIHSKIETRPEIGISFAEATTEQLKNSIPELVPKKVEYIDTVDEKPTKREYFVQPPEQIGISRKIHYKVDLTKAIIKDNVKYLRIQIKSKNAYDLDLLLKEVNLKKGEVLFFYSPDKKHISKSYTQYNANDKKVLSSPIIKGDVIVLEYNSTNFDEVGSFELNSAMHTYSENMLKGGLTPRGNCLNDVNCSQFDDYCNQIRSTNAIRVTHRNGGGYFCSGALINNASNDLTHYVLTAQHCVEDFETSNLNVIWFYGLVGAILGWLFDVEVNVSIPIDANRDIDVRLDNLRVIYNYQNPRCMNDDNNNYGIEDMVSTGADWIEVSGYFQPPTNLSNDIAVIRMNRRPEWQWNVYYAGWTTNVFDNLDVKCISHPKGGFPDQKDKKISEGLLIPSPPIGFSLWYVWWTNGTVLGGSSGGPLFNSDKKIIGPLSGSLTGCGLLQWARTSPPITSLVFNTSTFGKLGLWGDFNNFVGNGESSCEGLDPILSCQSHINLNDVFWAPISWREAKPSIKIQAGNTITISSDRDVLFIKNAEYKIVAGDEINILDETGNSLMFVQDTLYNTELEFYTAPCEWTEEQCGFNYFKMVNSRTSTNNLVEKEKNVFDLSLHPNPTTQNSTLTLIGYKERKANIIALDQTGKIIFTKTISKVENEKAEVEIESRNWTNGIYIIRVECNENTKAIKLVKE